ncbi:glycoside hydrolase family 76 protein [Kutzneria albida]|uniref:Glycoside hydrolase family 76 n=1 Tax=Kutzneria albida DSM 43870 TaxID=1449976 RepID=W5W4G7_9PSEU|nr:glycoside hydrolase family 76 protein [Kutzneria albida]AHH95650.1 glycoside hydrolase family 76 [Kutzneria albida DSM 43870]
MRIAVALLLVSALTAPTQVCTLYCDTRDPSLAHQETFPVGTKVLNGRQVRLHVDEADGMAWASIDNGVLNDSVWLDRSWDGGKTWDGLLGKAAIPGSWTGTRTLMFNMYDPSHHRRGVVRACGDAQGVGCTEWAYTNVCDQFCDGRDAGSAAGDTQPVPAATLNGRRFSLHVDNTGMAWTAVAGGRAGDEVWLDRSWDAGASWPDGSSLGRTTNSRTAMYATRDPRGWLYGGAVRACGRAVEGQNGSCTAWARPAADPVSAATEALAADYDPATGWWPSSWWNSAVALTTLTDSLARTGNTGLRWMIDRTFTVNRGTFPAGQRGSDPIEGDFRSRAIDDTAWWGLAWLNAYDLTRDRRYLDEAVVIADYVGGYWDTGTCGGGVWWDRERTYKNAVTNGLWVRLTAALHNRLPGDTAWLARARTAWTWLDHSGMINSSGLVNDGLTSSCANNGGTVWSYNQGLAIGGAVELWRATGDTSVLDRARTLAGAAATSPALTRNGILTESCEPNCDDNAKQFKGVFARYFGEFARATGSYQDYARRQAEAAWSTRDSLNRLGLRWSGQAPNPQDWRTQASALEALLW